MADGVLVDSNVLLDVLEDDPVWFSWSPIIYAELSIGFQRIEELEAVLPAATFERRPLPWEAAFLAGYRTYFPRLRIIAPPA